MPTLLAPARFKLSLLLLLIFLSLFSVRDISAADDAASYVLAPNDLLEIKVFQEDDLESKLRVAQNGTISFPLIGTVSVGGRTPHDAAAAIRSALAKDYLVNPQVTLTVVEYGKRRFTVLGQVQKAGAYDMPERENLTLLDAIAMAGGYTRIADPGKVTLKRREGSKEIVMKLNAKTMARDNQRAALQIKAGDIILVGESIF